MVGVLHPAQALARATAVGGRVADLVQREPRGSDQVCRWELVATLSDSPEDRAAKREREREREI